MALVLLPTNSLATRPGWHPIVETAIDIARDAGGLSFDGLVLDASGQLCLEPRTPPYLAGVVAAVRALGAETWDRYSGPGDPVHVTGHMFSLSLRIPARTVIDTTLPTAVTPQARDSGARAREHRNVVSVTVLTHPPQRARIRLAAARTRQLDRLAAHHAGPDGDLVLAQHAHGKTARHTSMVVASIAYSLFLNRKPCRGARYRQRASRREKSAS